MWTSIWKCCPFGNFIRNFSIPTFSGYKEMTRLWITIAIMWIPNTPTVPRHDIWSTRFSVSVKNSSHFVEYKAAKDVGEDLLKRQTVGLEAYRLQSLSLGVVEVAWEHTVTWLLGELCQEVCKVSLRKTDDKVKSSLHWVNQNTERRRTASTVTTSCIKRKDLMEKHVLLLHKQETK